MIKEKVQKVNFAPLTVAAGAVAANNILGFVALVKNPTPGIR